uniref:NAC domain-containing protein n=1 Tax=Tanacetum cinerariifolium TaxID=118510 RepID=A0A6L2J7J7_TANCI|nr:NAC domain-containing protein [Tanacetum cinerariifolium]
MLSLKNYNHDPLVDLYYPGGSDDYTEVIYDKEQCLSDRYITPITSPAYTPSIHFLATMKPADTFLMGDEVISTIPVREIDEFIKSNVDDLIPILREAEIPSQRGEIDFNPNDIETNDLIPGPRMFDIPLGNDDSVSRSFDVTFSNPLFDFIDDYTLGYEHRLFDEEFEDISSLDPPKSTLVIDESSLLVTPLPGPKQICLRKVERFDPFLSPTQSGGTTRVIETPSFGFHHMPLARPVVYSPKEVMYCYYHPHLTSGDGFDPKSKRFPQIVKKSVLVFNPPISRTPDVSVFKKVEEITEVEIRLLAMSVRTPDVSVV